MYDTNTGAGYSAGPPMPPPVVRQFYFDGGAGTYVGTALLAGLIILVSLGFAAPFAFVLHQRWRAKHTYINGYRLLFSGTGMGLFGNWVKWWLLILVTLGIYSFWIVPRLIKWTTEHTEFDPRGNAG